MVIAAVNHTYSTTGLVPSAIVSKPRGIAIAGAICSGDAKRIGEAWLDNDYVLVLISWMS
jgi:hypothetical protein